MRLPTKHAPIIPVTKYRGIFKSAYESGHMLSLSVRPDTAPMTVVFISVADAHVLCLLLSLGTTLPTRRSIVQKIACFFNTLAA